MSKKEMGYKELENFINENFSDALKKAFQASVDRGRAMRGARSRYGTSGDPFRSFAAGLKGEEAPQEDIFKGETEPGVFNKGLADIIAFYEKVANDIMPQAQSKWNQAIFKMKSTKRKLAQMLGPEAASKESTKNFFKGKDEAHYYDKGLKEIISYYEKATYDDPVKNLEKRKIVRILKDLRQEVQSIITAHVKAQDERHLSQPETPQEPEEQPQQPKQQQDSETDTEESEESEEESDNNTKGD